VSRVKQSRGLQPAIAVGTLVGLGVLALQAQTPLPAARVGVIPLVASAIGTIGGLVAVMVDDAAARGFGELWADLDQGDRDE